MLEGFADVNINIRATAFELFLLRRDCLEEIFNILQADEREYNRLLGFDLLSGIGIPEAEELIVRNFAKLLKLRRSGVVFILGRFSGDSSRELLIELATDKRCRFRDLRRAAITVLGLRGGEGAETLFYEIIKKRRFCRLYVGWRLRCAAAYALELSDTVEAQELLNNALDNFRRTVIMVWRDAMISWLKRRFGIVFNYLALQLNKVTAFLWRRIRGVVSFGERHLRQLFTMFASIWKRFCSSWKQRLNSLQRTIRVIIYRLRKKWLNHTKQAIRFVREFAEK